MLYDRASESTWYPLSANTLDAVGGPRQGDSIEFPAEHSDSSVLLPSDSDLERLRQRARADSEGE